MPIKVNKKFAFFCVLQKRNQQNAYERNNWLYSCLFCFNLTIFVNYKRTLLKFGRKKRKKIGRAKILPISMIVLLRALDFIACVKSIITRTAQFNLNFSIICGTFQEELCLRQILIAHYSFCFVWDDGVSKTSSVTYHYFCLEQKKYKIGTETRSCLILFHALAADDTTF